MTYEMQCKAHREPHRFLFRIAAVDFTGEAPCPRCGKSSGQDWSRKSLSVGGGPTIHSRRYVTGKKPTV